MHQYRQNVQSTKPTTTPSSSLLPSLSGTCTTTLFHFTNKSFSDQTGRFPVQSSKGHNYIMIFYHHDSNAILTTPLKSRSSEHITKAFITLHSYILQKGFTISMHVLDNEAPSDLIKYFKKEQVSYQLTPPYIHRANIAERAIQTFKNHFIAGLCSTPSSFPLHLWCRLLPQATITLNMLRPSTIHPQLSAHNVLEGQFNCMTTPLAPPRL